MNQNNILKIIVYFFPIIRQQISLIGFVWIDLMAYL